MKSKIGFLALMCHILYFQGCSCVWNCPNRNPQCMAENEMIQDGGGSTAYVYSGGSTSWEDWWTYDGISGPDFWGLLNLEWSLCSKGRRQSPVNIDPAGLLYDPSLRPIHVDKIRVNGVITNTGHGVIFRTTPSSHNEILNITGGPLSYKYRFSEIHIHFARSDEKGSEHLISGYQFPAEAVR
ncbi:putative carbonic anhydrase-like protein 2 [Argiope bruennichi]|uniref:Putative carbonic anhydrase-like protein 2 n=1 Tax=Argiope bruennichi TaxID=94029 RepID=A0A8T0FK28_ARGBR|nr:putative carbonic anhydrase-like protein 2 [Argiope bruennichi]